MFIDPKDLEDFLAQQIWRQTLTSIISYAITFRDRDKDGPTMEEMVQIQEDVGRRIQSAYDRVRGNRSTESFTSSGDRALIFERVLKDALNIMSESPV